MMLRSICCLIAVLLLVACHSGREKTAVKRILPGVNDTNLQNGDIIFQTSQSAQSKAIQLATHSPYSHCGIVFKENNRLYVFEAVQPVKATPLQDWIKRGKGGHYVVKRLKNADKILTADVLQKMKQEGEAMTGKDYDLTFEWSDNRIYCSELIWKIYKRAAGVEPGRLQRLGDFDLSDPAVQKVMKARYGSNVPLEEPVISPVAIYNSALLYTVQSN